MPPPVSLTQQASTHSTSSGPVTVTMPAAVTAGNTLLAAVTYYAGDGRSVVSVAGGGGTWTRIATVDVGDGTIYASTTMELWRSTAASAATTLTLAFDSGSDIYSDVHAVEFAGVVDVAAVTATGSTSPASSTAHSVPAGDAMYVWMSWFTGEPTATTDTPASWTTLDDYNDSTSTGLQVLAAYRVATGAESPQRTDTLDADVPWASITVHLATDVIAAPSTPVDVAGLGGRERTASAVMVVRTPLVVSADPGWESNGRTRDASATIDVDDAVVAPVAHHHLIPTAWLAITSGPDIDANGQPDPTSWTQTEHAGVWGRYRIRVDGKDVSFFRGAQSIVVNESDTEPFGDDVFTVRFPMISPFDHLGIGDLTWLPGGDDKAHSIVVEKVNQAGTRTVRWEGDCDIVIDTYDGQTGGLTVQFLGVVKTLDQRITKPRFTSDPIDVGDWIAQLVGYEVKYGWHGHAPHAVTTGTQTAERGGFGDPLLTSTIQNALAADGNHTLANLRPRGMRLIVKDRTTVHFTLWCGQRGVTHDLQRALEHGVRAIYGEGMDGGTQFWRNTVYPNAPISPPDYPLPSGQFFNPGDSHTGFRELADELRTRGYHMRSGDTYLAGDEPVVRDFQDDAGISVDGVVGGQTWNAAFTIALNAHVLQAFIRPLAVMTGAEPFLYNARGGIIGKNPNYSGASRRERLEQFGTLSKATAKKSAKAEIVVMRSADFVGTVTATNIDPPQMCALDTRAGMNLLFKGHRGVDRLLHIAKVDRNPGFTGDRTVTWTTSERGDDYVTLAARLQRKRDVVDQSGRTRPPRRSAKISPDFAPWDSESGAGNLKPMAQTAGLWNVYPIPAGERGQIVHVRLVADTACLMAAALFNDKVTAEQLVQLPGLADPSSGAAGGLDPWQVNTAYLTRNLGYADQPWMAWATGSPGAMQGYWPNTPDVGAGVTGVLDDSAGFGFHSARVPWLFLAVWTSATCRVSGDPAYRYRALFPGADT